MRTDIQMVVSQLLVGELIMNEVNYAEDRVAAGRKVCAALARDLGMSKTDLPEGLRAKFEAFLKAGAARLVYSTWLTCFISFHHHVTC